MAYTANQVLKRTVEGVLHKNRSSEVTGTLRSKTAIPAGRYLQTRGITRGSRARYCKELGK